MVFYKIYATTSKMSFRSKAFIGVLSKFYTLSKKDSASKKYPHHRVLKPLFSHNATRRDLVEALRWVSDEKEIGHVVVRYAYLSAQKGHFVSPSLLVRSESIALLLRFVPERAKQQKCTERNVRHHINNALHEFKPHFTDDHKKIS